MLLTTLGKQAPSDVASGGSNWYQAYAGQIGNDYQIYLLLLWLSNPPFGNLPSDLPASIKKHCVKKIVNHRILRSSTQVLNHKRLVLNKTSLDWYSYTILWNKSKNKNQQTKTTENILYLNCSTFTNIYNYQNSSYYILKLNAIHCM